MSGDQHVDILIVDDRAENLLALEAILEPLGQRVVRASSGRDALRRLLERDFAVILLDVQMPGMNGFETARLIKARERTRHVPIIFLTAISKDEGYVFEGYSVGAVDYLSKPFQPAVLRSKVAAFVDLHLKQKQIAEQEKLLGESQRRELELRHMQELWQSEARFREIVTSAMDAIIACDENGKITLFNAAAERMFGSAALDVVGQPITTFFPSGLTLESVIAICTEGTSDSASSATSTGVVAALQGVRATREEFPIEASVSCLNDAKGRTYTFIIRDISERVRHEEALRKQAAELKTLNEELNERQLELERAMTARSRFYASMSHELRTPINAVLGYSTLLLENIYGALNEKQQEGILRTQKAARHLLELVNDVLDLSKIEAGKIDLRLQPVMLSSLVEDLFVTVRPLADQYGSELTIEESGGPARIVSDPRRVRQILLNLLSNAIKFGRGKPIRVVCRTLADGAEIEVIDQGEGIPQEDQDRIFQEFVQLGKTQLQEGTGLGLPISRRLAELLNGELSLESNPGRGSIFRLRLPAAIDGRLPRGADQELVRQPADERPARAEPPREAPAVMLEPAGGRERPHES